MLSLLQKKLDDMTNTAKEKVEQLFGEAGKAITSAESTCTDLANTYLSFIRDGIMQISTELDKVCSCESGNTCSSESCSV